MSDRAAMAAELVALLDRAREIAVAIQSAEMVEPPAPVVVSRDVLSQVNEIAATRAAEAGAAAVVASASDPGFGDAAEFYDWLRGDKMLGPKISPIEYQGCTALCAAMAEAGWGIGWTAYGLATAYHEVAGTMQPIPERGGEAYLRRMYDIQGARPQKARELGNLSPGDGVKFAGRGYVQLTGKANYAKAGAALGVDLVNNPALALQPDIAAAIMVQGMEHGWFTGKRLGSYIAKTAQGTQPKFRECRRIINGLDKADQIADYALRFQKALVAGQWRIR